MFKKASVVFATFLLLGVQAVFAATVTNFKDVPVSHPNYTAIMDLKERGLVSGYPDGTFKPDQTVNRVEALKIILGSASLNANMAEMVDLSKLKDIDTTQWYAKYLSKAYQMGIVQGYPDGTFRPTQTVNLVENLKMLILAWNVDISKITVKGNPYADADQSQWYAKYVQYAKNANLLTPDQANNIFPAQGMTRAKLAEVAYRLIYIKENNLSKFGEAPKDIDEAVVDPDANTTNTDLQADTPEQILLKVQIKGSAFTPATMTVGQGSKVAWINNDSMTHSVVSSSGSELSSGDLKPGQTFSHVFDKLGTFEYYCAQHPNMKGTIIVKPAIEVPTI